MKAKLSEHGIKWTW